MTRLLVTGVAGYLGAAVARAARGWEIVGTHFSAPANSSVCPSLQLDLRDGQAVGRLLAELKPDAVIHTACSNRDDANISAILPAARHLATACRQGGIRLVHVSTDLVFDGEHAPYPDEAAPAPLTPYGRAKAEAEALLTSQYPESVIARPSLIWSLDPLDRQTGWLVDGLRRGTPVTLFTDEVRCPVHATDLAAALIELAASPQYAGPFNLGGPQALSRWDFGLRLLDALDLPAADNLRPGTVADSGLVRARNLTLLGRRAGQLLATRLRAVDEVLAGARNHAPQPEARGA